MVKVFNLPSCCATISFVWTRVTAADFDLQQSPYATPRLTPALLPIGGVRHKILTRSMRFLHTLPTGNHSRGEERGRYEGEVRSRDEKRRIRRFFKADVSSAEISWERRERGSRGGCSDMKHMMSAVTFTPALLTCLIKNAGIPVLYVCSSETQRQKTWGWRKSWRYSQFLFLNTANTKTQVLMFWMFEDGYIPLGADRWTALPLDRARIAGSLQSLC